MKIALCLSGLLRNLNPSYFLNLGVDVDIFCHTWDYCDISELNVLNPKEINVEDDNNAFKYTSVNVESWPYMGNSPRNHVYKMYYSMKRCIDMVEDYELKNNFKYDLIIRSRYDIKANIKNKGVKSHPDQSFDIYNINCNKNDIIFPLKGVWVGKSIDTRYYRFAKSKLPNKTFRLSDAFFIGSDACRILCKTYDHFEILKNEYNAYMHNENLIAHMCLHYNMNTIVKNFECNLCRKNRN